MGAQAQQHRPRVVGGAPHRRDRDPPGSVDADPREAEVGVAKRQLDRAAHAECRVERTVRPHAPDADARESGRVLQRRADQRPAAGQGDDLGLGERAVVARIRQRRAEVHPPGSGQPRERRADHPPAGDPAPERAAGDQRASARVERDAGRVGIALAAGERDPPPIAERAVEVAGLGGRRGRQREERERCSGELHPFRRATAK
jgi:hypothetical protein